MNWKTKIHDDCGIDNDEERECYEMVKGKVWLSVVRGCK